MSELSLGFVQAILKGFERLGIDTDELLAAAEMKAFCEGGANAALTFEEQTALWDEAFRRTADVHLGLHWGEVAPTEPFGLVAEAVAASATLGDAMERYIELHPLVSSTSALKLDRQPERARLSFRLKIPPFLFPRHLAEGFMVKLWRDIRRLVRGDVRLLEVSFEHPEPSSKDEHARIFGCPVRFSKQGNEMVLPATCLDTPLPSADAELSRRLDMETKAAMARLAAPDELVLRVREAIFDSLSSGDVAMASIARKIDRSAASLRRELTDRGLTFQRLLNGMRRELAAIYLQDRGWSLSDVAFVLGFSDPAAFKRTFKRWTGYSPGDYRRLLFLQGGESD